MIFNDIGICMDVEVFPKVGVHDHIAVPLGTRRQMVHSCGHRSRTRQSSGARMHNPQLVVVVVVGVGVVVGGVDFDVVVACVVVVVVVLRMLWLLVLLLV